MVLLGLLGAVLLTQPVVSAAPDEVSQGVRSARLLPDDAARPLPAPAVVQVGVQLAGGALGAGVGGWLTYLYWSTSNQSLGAVLITMALAPVAISLGILAGVQLGGNVLGGRGNIGVTLIGMIVGALAATAVATPLVGADRVNLVPFTLVFPIAGAVIGYQWSQPGDEESASGPRVLDIGLAAARSSDQRSLSPVLLLRGAF